jgi:hypothetical protein
MRVQGLPRALIIQFAAMFHVEHQSLGSGERALQAVAWSKLHSHLLCHLL